MVDTERNSCRVVRDKIVDSNKSHVVKSRGFLLTGRHMDGKRRVKLHSTALVPGISSSL